RPLLRCSSWLSFITSPARTAGSIPAPPAAARPGVLCPHPRSSPMPATRKPATRKTTAKRPATRSAKSATRKSVAPAKTSKSAAPAAAPTLDAVLAELKKLGTPQTAKTYRRHGAVEPLFGVKFGDLKPLAKKIGRNHDLAERLWATGNFDAMNLACMLADPARINDAAADRWLKSAGNYCACGLLADVIGRSPAARSRIAAWTASPAEYT